MMSGGHPRTIRTAVLASLLVSLFLVSGERVGSHVPITTRITFNREVVRILRQHCLECHSPRGIKSDQPLLTYAEARPWAKAIKEEVLNRRMAPYRAVPGFGHFLENYHLPAREQELLISWIEGGVPRGEEKDYPPGLLAAMSSPRTWSLGDPDQILQPTVTTRVGASPFAARRCFNLPVGNPRRSPLRMIEFMPGNGRVVFSASVYLAPAGRGDGCAVPERSLTPVGEWVPGQRSFPTPPGMARVLPPRATIVLKVEYRGSAEPESDQSLVGLYLDRTSPDKVVETISIRHTTRPSGSRVAVDHRLSADEEILAIRPLLEPGSGSFEARLTRPDGSTEVLVFARDYRFEWQPTYHFRTPRLAPRGSTIAIIINSNRPPSPTLCQIVSARSRSQAGSVSTLEDRR
ncbi:MAG: hypothetical protein ACOYLF_17495 [Blastocatellia bacterium]|jgi:hypothetical protein